MASRDETIVFTFKQVYMKLLKKPRKTQLSKLKARKYVFCDPSTEHALLIANVDNTNNAVDMFLLI